MNEEHASLVVDPQTGAYLCHRCGRKGKLNVQSASSPVARRRREEGLVSNAVCLIADEWKEIWEASFDVTTVGGEDAQYYLNSRGFTSGKWFRDNDVRYNPNFYGEPSVMFGIRNLWGELVGCQGRRIAPAEGHSKVCTAKGSQPGLFLSRPEAILADPLIICESPIDALSLDVMGYPAVSVQGTRLPEWINYITYFRRVVVAPDNDEEGCRAVERWRNSIICQGCTVAVPPHGKDWNESLLNNRGWNKVYGSPPRGDHPMLAALAGWFCS